MNAYSLHESAVPAETALAASIDLIETGGFVPEYSDYGHAAPDEFVNTVTHGFGFLMACVGAQAMLSRLVGHDDPWFAAGCLVYLFGLVGVYAFSTLAHGATSAKWKPRFRALDQGFIYLLIVGSYTPYSLAYLHGPQWLAVLCVMWSIALVGFVSKVVYAHRVDAVSVKVPLALAWVPIVAMPSLMYAAPAGAFQLIIVGGICYMAGIPFFIYDNRGKHFHAVWHLCVMAGSTCHFCGLLSYAVG